MAAAYKLTGGRSSVSGMTATVFGASGFLGSYVVNQFGKVGSRCILPYRGDEIQMRKLKPMGDLGQVHPYQMSIRNIDEIQRAISESNIVINLLGRHLETSRFSFQDVNVSFPAVLAELCAEQGVERLVHVSAMGASTDSPSAWLRSKAAGEAAVLEGYPDATIVRPATMFGDEDRFLNRIAKLTQSLPFMPLVDAGATTQQPVYVNDVASAIFWAATTPETAGTVLDLAGPKVYTNKQIHDFVLKKIDEPNNAFDLPPSIGNAMAFAMQQLPDAWMTVDGLKLQGCNIVSPDGKTGFEEMGLVPTAMEDLVDRYLVRFRKKSLFVDENEVVKQPQS